MALKNKGANRNENADFVTLRLVWQVDRNSLSLCTQRFNGTVQITDFASY